MVLALGCVLGIGLLLAVSPFLWPRPTAGAGPSRLATLARDRLTQAGLHSVTLPTLVVVSLVAGLATTALAFALVPVTALAACAGAAGVLLPALVIRSQARSRRRVNRAVWPDIVDHLLSAVRAGMALPDSVSALAHTGPASVRREFASFECDYRATGNFGLSLDNLKDRLADPVADRVLETMRMSREVGGSELTTVLRNLAVYLRQDSAVRAEVEARQSWVLNAARLGVAAPWIILALLSTRPEAATAYNSATGVALIVGGLVVSVIAYRVMLGIGRMPEEQRWFR
ncbi:type II secretion system F family protein [Marisediminicola senii]|uniref:type II secretion system F family protein n=1 Tax=Marisediminicola senii TaxID=2711233 RepID=UPI0013EAF039|nr:type II secretion system F family protein [Marisediminicola senii]